MLTTALRWIPEAAPARLAISARPRGGEWLHEEISAWGIAGVRTVVSLLEPTEVRELELTSEEALCGECGIAFFSLPVPDRGVPSSSIAVRVLVETLVERLREGHAVAVHCRAGIGRTGVLAACILLALGVPFEKVFTVISRARGVSVPDTPAQTDWVRQYSYRNGAAL